MVNNPIYKPKGTAKEYGDLALNIYTGCPTDADSVLESLRNGANAV